MALFADGVHSFSDLGGDWKAWISNSSTSPSVSFNQYDGTYALLNGNIIATSWDDLTDGSIGNPINVAENSLPVTVDFPYAWTNTSAAGDQIVALSWSCSNFTVGTLGTGGAVVGSLELTDEGWTEDTGDDIYHPHHTCDTWAHIYCFEQ